MAKFHPIRNIEFNSTPNSLINTNSFYPYNANMISKIISLTIAMMIGPLSLAALAQDTSGPTISKIIETHEDAVEVLYEKMRGKSREEQKKLYEAEEKLAIGKVAREIIGKDVHGKEMKLSDYRGKIVVLDFWGDWRGPCRAMYPHGRSLVARMKDKPFTILGVNSDSAKRYKTAIKENEITWPSFWDGGKTGGPIATDWSVRGWPTIYILDTEGVIRYKNTRGKAMDEAVDALMEEL